MQAQELAQAAGQAAGQAFGQASPPATPSLPTRVEQGEQEEYGAEGIAWTFIDYVDNQDCLDL